MPKSSHFFKVFLFSFFGLIGMQRFLVAILRAGFDSNTLKSSYFDMNTNILMLSYWIHITFRLRCTDGKVVYYFNVISISHIFSSATMLSPLVIMPLESILAHKTYCTVYCTSTYYSSLHVYQCNKRSCIRYIKWKITIF